MRTRKGRDVAGAVGLVVALCGVASPAAAQSLFGSRGLGVVTTPVDARGAALGGLGVALPGVAGTLVNPADAADVNRRGVIVAMQPSSTELETSTGTDGVDATRFPLVQFLMPIGRDFVVSAGYGSFLDQNWGVFNESEVVIGPDSVMALDRVISTGGIAQGRLGVAWSPTEDLTFGAGAGLLTGSTTLLVRRDFFDDEVGLSPFAEETRTSYTAPMATVGARYRIGSAVLVSGALTWMGDMTADVDGGGETELSMPLQFAGGASAQLLEDLLVVVNTRWTGWSATEGLDAPGEDALELGGGVEWTGIRSVRRTFPVRLGARWGAQPFVFGDEAPTEAAVAFGLGARLAGSEETPAALVDLAVERGARGDTGSNGVSESFWRVTVSVSLFSQ